MTFYSVGNPLNSENSDNYNDNSTSLDMELQNIEFLLKQNPNNLNNREFQTGYTLLFKNVITANISVIEYLLVHGADPNIPNTEGKTPLYVSIEIRNTKITKLLLKYGANPNNQLNNGNTPMHVATLNNDVVSVELLLHFKADPTIVNVSTGLNVLETAMLSKRSNIVEMLLNYDRTVKYNENMKNDSFKADENEDESHQSKLAIIINHTSNSNLLPFSLDLENPHSGSKNNLEITEFKRNTFASDEKYKDSQHIEDIYTLSAHNQDDDHRASNLLKNEIEDIDKKLEQMRLEIMNFTSKSYALKCENNIKGPTRNIQSNQDLTLFTSVQKYKRQFNTFAKESKQVKRSSNFSTKSLDIVNRLKFPLDSIPKLNNSPLTNRVQSKIGKLGADFKLNDSISDTPTLYKRIKDNNSFSLMENDAFLLESHNKENFYKVKNSNFKNNIRVDKPKENLESKFFNTDYAEMNNKNSLKLDSKSNNAEPFNKYKRKRNKLSKDQTHKNLKEDVSNNKSTLNNLKQSVHSKNSLACGSNGYQDTNFNNSKNRKIYISKNNDDFMNIQDQENCYLLSYEKEKLPFSNIYSKHCCNHINSFSNHYDKLLQNQYACNCDMIKSSKNFNRNDVNQYEILSNSWKNSSKTASIYHLNNFKNVSSHHFKQRKKSPPSKIAIPKSQNEGVYMSIEDNPTTDYSKMITNNDNKLKNEVVNLSEMEDNKKKTYINTERILRPNRLQSHNDDTFRQKVHSNRNSLNYDYNDNDPLKYNVQINESFQMNDEILICFLSASNDIFQYKDTPNIIRPSDYMNESIAKDVKLQSQFFNKSESKLLKEDFDNMLMENESLTTMYINTNEIDKNFNKVKDNNANSQLNILESLDKIKMPNYLNSSQDIEIRENQKQIYNFLSCLKLEKYTKNFIILGFDDLGLLLEQIKQGEIPLTNEILKKIGIVQPGDKAKIILKLESQAQIHEFEIPNSAFHTITNDLDNDPQLNRIYSWLESLKLNNYVSNFVNSGFHSLDLILLQSITSNPLNNQILECEINIDKLGYRTRILNKINYGNNHLNVDSKKLISKLKIQHVKYGNGSNLMDTCKCSIF